MPINDPNDTPGPRETTVAPPPATPDLARNAPLGDAGRIGSLDVLRGFAVLGILLLNIQAFAMPGAAYMNPTAYGDLEGANYWVWYLGHVFGDQKFMSIFSMLFGAGIILMTQRAEARTGRSAGLHYRRMGWLIVFGLLHAHLIWYGDILYGYGMCGLLAWTMRRWSPLVLMPVGLVFMAIPSAISIFSGWSLAAGFWPPEAVEQMAVSWTPSAEEIAKEIGAYRGGWLAQMPARSLTALMFETQLFLFFLGPKAGGMMLFGMALYKAGVLQAQRSVGFYAAMAAGGLVIGLPLIAYGVHLHEAGAWAIERSFFLVSQFNYWASFLVALGYIGLVMLACKVVSAAVLHPLACAGRMAFTNYIAQSIICTMIFYGHGFGYFGRLDRTEMLGVVLAVWAVQLVWSPIYLRHFRFGPLEWMWRTVTYGRRPAMERSAPAAP